MLTFFKLNFIKLNFVKLKKKFFVKNFHGFLKKFFHFLPPKNKKKIIEQYKKIIYII